MADKGVKFRLKATDETKAAFSSVQGNITRTQGLSKSWNAGLNANRRAVQQFGFQMTDFAVQIAGGQNAMLAFTQQGGQMLQFFGPMGAIMAALLAVFGSLFIALQRSGKAMSDLAPAAGVLINEFRMIGKALSWVKERMIDFANLVVNNLDRILITASLVAGFFAGRWVIAFVAARLATMTLAGALMTLRTALIRTGIGALIIAAGELVYMFMLLVQGASGFGAALGLLRDFAVEVWGRITLAATVMSFRMHALWLSIKAVITDVLADGVNRMIDFANKAIGATIGIVNGMRVLWHGLPIILKEAAQLAVNELIDILGGAVTFVSEAISDLFEKVGLARIPPPNFSSFKTAVVGGTAVVAQAAVNEFNKAFGKTYILPNTALKAMAKQMELNASAWDKMADNMQKALGKPLKSWQDIKDAITKAAKAGKDIDLRDLFGGGKDGTGGLSEQAKKIEKMFKDLSSGISDSLKTAFGSLLDKTKSLSDIISDMLVDMLNKVAKAAMDPVWDAIGKGITGFLMGTPTATGFTGGIFSNWFSKIAKFDGGGSTGSGTRAGGIDGKGGFMAMLHPNETVFDHSKGQMVGGGSTNVTTAVEVHIHENAAEQTRVEQSSGRIDIFLRKQITDTIRGGGIDSVMRDRFNVRPRAAGA